MTRASQTQNEPPGATEPGAPIDWGRFWCDRAHELTPYAIALTRDPHQAEELIQMVLVSMVQTDPRPASPLAYVLRAIRHAAIDRARRDGAARRAIGVLSVGSGWLAGSEGPEGPGTGRGERLGEALAGLTDEQREVIVLRTRSGLTLGEVGQVLGRAEGTVASQYARGIARLRELLASEQVTKDGHHD